MCNFFFEKIKSFGYSGYSQMIFVWESIQIIKIDI